VNALGACDRALAEMSAELGRDGLVDVVLAASANSELALLCRQTESLASHVWPRACQHIAVMYKH
jgi:hypothetical protein